MDRRDFMLKTGVLAGGVGLAGSVARAEKPLHQRLGKGDVNTSLEIFNLWGDQSAESQAVLSAAHAYLVAGTGRTMAGLAAQPEFQSLCQAAGMTHLGGPMLGNISSSGATVWVRTLKPARVSVEVAGKRFGPVMTTVASDLAAVVPVTGLRPGSESAYRVLIDGQPVNIPADAVIRTVPDENVCIAFGSCWHRWGLGNPLMNLVRARQPAALLMIGDIAVQDRMGHLGLHRQDFLQRDLTPVWQRFCATVPVYAGWDDHDYADNDVSGVTRAFTAQDRAGIREVFKQSWVNPQYGTDAGGTFLRTRIGPADVIMTDNRYFREAGMGRNHFLGRSQMEWLKAQLLDCKGPFIILSCGTMWSDYVSDGKDSWGKYDREGREEIFQLIEEHQIKGVLLISGDRHGARGFTIPRESGFDFYEFGGASYGGRIGPPAKHKKWTHQLYGIAGRYAFSEFEFNTSKPDPEVTFRLTGADGNLIHQMTLTRSQLTPQK